MNAVFLDTAGLIALWNERDQWHSAASAAYAKIDMKSTALVTTSFVLAECANAVARSTHRATVSRLRRSLEGRQRVLFPDEELWRDAWEKYVTDRVGGASLVDQLSFGVMRQHGVAHAFTNDEHFRTSGFTTLF